MIEVYRQTVIMVSDTYEGLINHHNYTTSIAIIYNQKEWPDGQGKIEIGPFANTQEHLLNYKELFNKEVWDENNYDNYFKGMVRGDFIVRQQGTYEMRVFDERCVYQDKRGAGYKMWFQAQGTSDDYGYPEYPDIGADEVSSEIEKEDSLIMSWKVNQDDWIKIGLESMSEPSKEELQAFKEKTNHEKQLEIEENLKSWEE